MSWLARRRRPDVPVRSGERVLAWTTAADGTVLAGTRDACYLGSVRIGWEQVESADWDAETEIFRLRELDTAEQPRADHEFVLVEPGTFVELVRERVTASVVVVHRVAVGGGRGLRVIARRAPSGGPMRWVYEFDDGLDPTDPQLRAVAAEALAAAREAVGEAG